MTEENKNNPFHPDFHRDLLSRIPRQPTPFHSDFHREAALWLKNNRHLSPEERINEVVMLMFKHDMIKLDLGFLLHYAASCFITLDAWDKFSHDQFPEILSVVAAKNIKSGKDIANHQKAKKAVNARHDKPGGSRDKAAQIRAIWATGKYTTRDICAEEEYQSLGYKSFGAARRALQNTPDPEKNHLDATP